MEIKAAADPVRHGNIHDMSSDDRENMFIKTWNVVDSYLSYLKIHPMSPEDPSPVEHGNAP